MTDRYRRAAHSVQTGVAMEMQFNDKFTNPKHLRTGLNLSKSDQCGLVRLLIAKGIFSEEEYLEAITVAAEDEKTAAELRLSDLLGKKVTLL